MKRNQKTNPGLVSLILDLKRMSWKNNAPIWRDIAVRLEKPSKSWAEVNISRIALHVKKGETIVVPGKVLGAGDIDFSVTVGAYQFSNQAREKIEKAGGKVLQIADLAQKQPKGKGVRIIG